MGPASARADAASGDWTGVVELQTNYFRERSTSVVMPDIGLQLVSPGGTRIAADYLIDVISSASIAQSASDGGVFTEQRHQAGGSLGQDFDLGVPASLSIGFTYSHENDYRSRTYLASGSLSLWQRTTTLGLSAAYSDDTVLDNRNPSFRAARQALTLNTQLEQVLSPRVTLSGGYSLSSLAGFLANPYRRVRLGPLPVPETHPDTRLRHAGFVHLAWFVPKSDTALHVTQRVFIDSWRVHALSPTLQVVQALSDGLLVSLLYRLYSQSGAYFFRSVYPPGQAGYVSNDPKLDRLTTHTLGGRLDLRLAMLQGAWPWLAQGWAVVSFDRYWSTSAFGSGYLASAGLRLPF